MYAPESVGRPLGRPGSSEVVDDALVAMVEVILGGGGCDELVDFELVLWELEALVLEGLLEDEL